MVDEVRYEQVSSTCWWYVQQLKYVECSCVRVKRLLVASMAITSNRPRCTLQAAGTIAYLSKCCAKQRSWRRIVISKELLECR